MILTRSEIESCIKDMTISSEDVEHNASVILEILMDKEKEKIQVEFDSRTLGVTFTKKGKGPIQMDPKIYRELGDELERAILQGKPKKLIEMLAEMGMTVEVILMFIRCATDSFKLHLVENGMEGLLSNDTSMETQH